MFQTILFLRETSLCKEHVCGEIIRHEIILKLKSTHMDFVLVTNDTYVPIALGHVTYGLQRYVEKQ